MVNKKLLFYNLITMICDDFMNSECNLVREVMLLYTVISLSCESKN